MIDIGEKKKVPREAEAVGTIDLREETLEKVRQNEIKKGEPLDVAEISAIQAVKNTPDTIPHCHPIPIEGIDISLTLKDNRIKVKCRVKAVYKTGVEMEALNGVTAALLTIWDMVKYLEKDVDGQYPETEIKSVKVTEKKKGDQDAS